MKLTEEQEKLAERLQGWLSKATKLFFVSAIVLLAVGYCGQWLLGD